MKDHLTPFVEQITHAPATVMAGDVVEAGKVYAVLEQVYAEGLREGKAEMQEMATEQTDQVILMTRDIGGADNVIQTLIAIRDLLRALPLEDTQ